MPRTTKAISIEALTLYTTYKMKPSTSQSRKKRSKDLNIFNDEINYFLPDIFISDSAEPDDLEENPASTKQIICEARPKSTEKIKAKGKIIEQEILTHKDVHMEYFPIPVDNINKKLELALPTLTDPIDSFELFFSKDVFYMMSECINREIKEKKPHLKVVDPAEIKIFVGLLILMGILRKPSIKEYWSNDKVFSTPIFNEMMPRDRFLLIYGLVGAICKCYSIEPTSNQFNGPHFEDLKSSSILRHLKNKFLEFAPSDKSFCITHSVIPHSGLIDPFLKGSKKEVTITNIFSLSLKYCANFELSVGKMTKLRKHNLVNTLVCGLEHQGNSVAITHDLMSKITLSSLEASGIAAFGFANKQVFNSQKDKFTDFEVESSGKKTFFLLRNHENIPILKMLREDKNLNQSLNGLESRNRQLLNCFKPRHLSSKKLGVKIFKYVLELAIINSRALFGLNNPKNFNNKNFRLSLATMLLKDKQIVTPPTQQLVNVLPPITEADLQDPAYLEYASSLFHFPNKGSRRGYCVHCRMSRINTFCTKCRHFYCLDDCFLHYHLLHQHEG